MEVAWVAVAYALGLAASAAGLPPLVGYLGAGVAISGLGFTGGALLSEIGHLGVLFLLFTVGLHIRPRNVARPEVLVVGGVHIVLSGVVFAGVAWVAGMRPGPSILLGALLAFSSTVVAAKSLEARNDLESYHGRVTVGILILQDVAAVALIGAVGLQAPSPWALLLLLLPLTRPLLARLARMSDSDELLLLLGLLLAWGGGALFALAGLSSELGALALGALLAGQPRAEELAEKLWGLKEAFLVGFFLEVGLRGLPGPRDLLLLGGLIALLPLKGTLFFALLVRSGLRARTSFMSAVALSTYSEFTLIAGGAAAAAGLLPESALVVLALATAVSFATNAPVNVAANRLYARWEPRLLRFERPGPHPDEQPRGVGSSRHIVVGMGRTGAAAYDHLSRRGHRPLGLDSDPGKITEHRGQGRRVDYGDAQDPELWATIRLDGIESVILAVPSLEAKVSATRALRERGFTGRVSALSVRLEETERLREAGAGVTCLPEIEAGVRLAEESLRPAARAA